MSNDTQLCFIIIRASTDYSMLCRCLMIFFSQSYFRYEKDIFDFLVLMKYIVTVLVKFDKRPCQRVKCIISAVSAYTVVVWPLCVFMKFVWKIKPASSTLKTRLCTLFSGVRI